MDTRKLLDDILVSGREYLDKGKQFAEEQIDLPEEGAEREAKLDGLKKGALAAGGLALLLGTRSGRWLAGNALKVGSLAALGGIAYQAYKSWGSNDQKARPVHELEGSEAEARNLLLLRAMIAAAKADGHIDGQEQVRIESELEKMGATGQEGGEFLKREIANSLDTDSIASAVDSREAAAEVYLVSRLLLDTSNDAEKAYLEELASKLGLGAEEIDSLENRLK